MELLDFVIDILKKKTKNNKDFTLTYKKLLKILLKAQREMEDYEQEIDRNSIY